MEHIELFLNTAMERHRVYVKKEEEKREGPWTEDPIFREFFFCNLFRKYDKCSKWMVEKIIPLNDWKSILLYRFISTYPLYKEIEDSGIALNNLGAVHVFLRNKHISGEKLFSSCFIRNPRIKGGWTETYNVPFYLVKEIEEDGRVNNILAENSLEKMVSYLSNFSGTAGFMGYEYACDFEYTELFYPTDKQTWANMGPGAQRGMSLVEHGTDKVKYSQSEWLEKALVIRDTMAERFFNTFPDRIEVITMREVEHWLCEFQKYCKYFDSIRTGRHIKHRKYRGGINGVL